MAEVSAAQVKALRVKAVLTFINFEAVRECGEYLVPPELQPLWTEILMAAPDEVLDVRDTSRARDYVVAELERRGRA